MLPLKICANVECCHDFMAKMDVGTALVQIKYWYGFMNVGMTLMQMKFWRGFMNVGTASVRMKCWRVNVECCRGFMTKMNVGIALVRMKCWCGFMAKTSIGMTPVLIWNGDVTSWLHSVGANGVLTWLHECWHNFNTNEVLSWLHGKDGCWHGFNINEVLLWLHRKDGCWHGFSANKVLTWLGANIGATSMRVQVLMWSVVVASWQRWTLA